MTKKKPVAKPPEVEVTRTTETTAPTPPKVKINDYVGDPMWNTRRRGMWIALGCAFGWLNLITLFALAGILDPAEIDSLAGIGNSVSVFAAPIMAAWFAASEYGRVNGVLGTQTTTATSVSQPPKE